MNADYSSLPCPPAGQPAALWPPREADVATSIVIADSTPLFRRGLAGVMAQTFPDFLLHEAASADELLVVAGRLRPALVLLAANLARTPAVLLALLDHLQPAPSPASVVVFIDPGAGFELAGLRLLHHKVSCLLTRTASPAEVCDSIRAVLQQRRHYSEHLLALLLQAPAARRAPATGGFSTRQLEVLRLMAEDLSNEEIADRLCTSVRTVEYHRSQMLHKTGLRTSLGLVLFAQRQGLLSVPAAPAVSASTSF